MGRTTRTKSRAKSELERFKLWFEEPKEGISPSRYLIEKMVLDISRNIRRERNTRRAIQLRQSLFNFVNVYLNYIALTL